MIKKLTSNEFNKNVIKLLTGATIAQAIPIAISPILTRLYTPNDFGVLALFVAITTIFGSIANARYELAIVLPEKEEDAINLVALSILISTSLSLILFVIVIFLKDIILVILDNQEISFWLYFSPLVVFFIGLFNALNYMHTRLKNFGLISKVNIIRSIGLSIIQLSFGFLKLGVGGLISGQIFSHLIANTRLIKNIINDKQLIKAITVDEMVRLSKRYSDFPKYSMWAILANTLSKHINSVFIASLYSTSILGYYSLTQRILGVPINLMGQTIGQVFFREATKEKKQKGNAYRTFKSTFIKLLLISIPLFSFLFFFIEDLISFVFGEDWIIAGVYAKIILPLMMMRFIMVPLSLINVVFERQRVELLWQASFLILTISIFFISNFLSLNIEGFLTSLSIILSLHYFVLFFITLNVSKNN